MNNAAEDQLALAKGLTAKTNQLCLGLESGAADILELVTQLNCCSGGLAKTWCWPAVRAPQVVGD